MELEEMKKLIKKYEPGHSGFIMEADTAERYYRNETDILFRRLQCSREPEKSLWNTDNCISGNFHGLIVNQKASYMFTSPPLFDVGDTKNNDIVLETLGDDYRKTCMDLCINAANMAVAWLHYWTDEKGTFQYAAVDSRQIIPVWLGNLKKKLIGCLRVYEEIDNEAGDNYTIYEYWNDESCYAFRKESKDTVEEGLYYYNIFENPGTGEMIPEYRHESEEVPFIPFFNNNIHTSDLKNIKPLIDLYDKVYNGFINNLDDLQELKKYMEIPVKARNSVLETIRKAIYEQGQGFDPAPESFGNQSEEALKLMYSLLEMKAGFTEMEFQSGFSKLVRAICRHNSISCKKIIQTWTRTHIRNDVEQAQICRDSVAT